MFVSCSGGCEELWAFEGIVNLSLSTKTVLQCKSLVSDISGHFIHFLSRTFILCTLSWVHMPALLLFMSTWPAAGMEEAWALQEPNREELGEKTLYEATYCCCLAYCVDSN